MKSWDDLKISCRPINRLAKSVLMGGEQPFDMKSNADSALPMPTIKGDMELFGLRVGRLTVIGKLKPE